MDRNGFSSTSAGQLVPTISGRKAFIPNPLPPVALDLNPVLPILSRATQAVGELKGIGRTIPNPLLLVRPLQRREAVSSSGMEGTFTTLSDLFMFEAGVSAPERRSDNREVLNYVRALEGAIADLATLPDGYGVVNIKLDKTGGLTAVLDLAHAARQRGLDVMTGCMICSSLSIAPAWAIAASSAFADLDGPLWLAEDRAGGVSGTHGLLSPPQPGFWGGV